MRRPVYDHTHVTVPFDGAASLLRRDPGLWLPAPATPDADGWIVTMQAPGMLATPSVDAMVQVSAPTVDRPALFVRPLTWRAAVADRLFPTLMADLEVEAVNGTAIRLAIVGSYRPPVSVVGAAGDRLVGHHIAEAVVRTFLESVAERIVESTPEASTLAT